MARSCYAGYQGVLYEERGKFKPGKVEENQGNPGWTPYITNWRQSVFIPIRQLTEIDGDHILDKRIVCLHMGQMVKDK